MQNTVDGILAALDTAYTTDSAAAAALGLSRQAYSLIKQRRALSDAVCIRAAELLGLDPAETLIRLQIDRANTPETRATYENILNRLTRTPEATDNGGQNTPEENNPHPAENAADNPRQTFHNQRENTNYAPFEYVERCKKTGLFPSFRLSPFATTHFRENHVKKAPVFRTGAFH